MLKLFYVMVKSSCPVPVTGLVMYILALLLLAKLLFPMSFYNLGLYMQE